MSRDTELKQLRDAAICRRYKELSEKTVPIKKELIGKVTPQRLYRHTAVLEMMSTEFYLTPDTIERIVSDEGKGDKEDETQFKMDL